MTRYALDVVSYAPLYIHSFRLVQPHTLVEAEKFNLIYTDPTQIDNIADKLRWYRYQHGLLQRDVADYAGLDRSIGQYFAALTNMRSVGVMGDERTYDYAVALRAVNTIDFMTAEAAEIPWEVLGRAANRIVNEVKNVNRVLYDCTGKPPATIEFE